MKHNERIIKTDIEDMIRTKKTDGLDTEEPEDPYRLLVNNYEKELYRILINGYENISRDIHDIGQKSDDMNQNVEMIRVVATELHEDVLVERCKEMIDAVDIYRRAYFDLIDAIHDIL